jgi:hypothetical protein
VAASPEPPKLHYLESLLPRSFLPSSVLITTMDTPGSPPYYPDRVMLTVELPDNLDDDDFEWPDHAPEPPPTPPPLPIMVTSESCIPKELKGNQPV